MQHYKETKFVMYVDDFLSTESLLSLQKTMTEITEYSIAKDDDGNVFGFRYFFSKFDPSLIKAIKEFFFPTRDLVPVSVSSNIRFQNNENVRPLFHLDNNKGYVANFLLYVKGEPLLNNGTGFLYSQDLSAHIGFVENRALFFNGTKIPHNDLQCFGDSSMRYTLNIFYKENEN
jgi:hypothetical protein